MCMLIGDRPPEESTQPSFLNRLPNLATPKGLGFQKLYLPSRVTFFARFQDLFRKKQLVNTLPDQMNINDVTKLGALQKSIYPPWSYLSCWKMMAAKRCWNLGDDPFLLGFGLFLGAFLLILGRVISVSSEFLGDFVGAPNFEAHTHISLISLYRFQSRIIGVVKSPTFHILNPT